MATPSGSYDDHESTNQRIVRAFRSHFKMLVDVLDPEEAALALYQEKLISKTTLEEALSSNSSKSRRSYKVVEAVETYLGICTSTTTAHRILTILERNSISGPDSVIARIRRQAMSFGGEWSESRHTNTAASGAAKCQSAPVKAQSDVASELVPESYHTTSASGTTQQEQATAEGIDPPTVDLLLEATYDVAKWRVLGLKLGLKAYDLDCLHSTYHAEGVDTLKLKMIQEWLKRFPRASWDDVIKALKEMKENTAAERIERERHQQSSVTVPVQNKMLSLAESRQHKWRYYFLAVVILLLAVIIAFAFYTID